MAHCRVKCGYRRTTMCTRQPGIAWLSPRRIIRTNGKSLLEKTRKRSASFMFEFFLQYFHYLTHILSSLYLIFPFRMVCHVSKHFCNVAHKFMGIYEDIIILWSNLFTCNIAYLMFVELWMQKINFEVMAKIH